MPRVPSDDEQLASVRVTLARSGGTRRLCVRLPERDELERRLESGDLDALDVAAGDVVRVTFGREEHHAAITADSRGRLIRGAFDNRRLARSSGEGTNRLAEWLGADDREEGDTLVLDVLVPGEAYGLRVPGERVVYDVRRGPRSSLSDIAEGLDG